MRSLLLLLSACGYCNFAFAVEVTFEEARSSYAHNLLAVTPFSCRISTETILTEDYFDVLVQRIARLQRGLSNVASSDRREFLENELVRLKDLLDAKARYPLHREATFAIGLHSVQIGVASSGAAPRLPVETQARLEDDCSNAIVLSWATKQKPNSWMWQGRGRRNDEILHATVSSRRPQDLLTFPVVPVGLSELQPFERETLSPFDAFFGAGFANTRVIGTDVVKGERVLVVERSYGVANTEETVRSLLSFKYSFFPLHMTWKGGTSIEVDSFAETPSGAFYPTKWTIKTDAYDDRSAEDRNPALLGKKRFIASIETCLIADFQSDQGDPSLLSELGLPDGTYCLDDDRRVYFTVGKAEPIVNTVLDGSSPSTENDRRTPVAIDVDADTREYTWLFWLNFTVILCIVGLISVRYLWNRFGS